MSWDDTYREECQLAAPFFAPDLAAKIRRSVPGNYRLDTVLPDYLPNRFWSVEFPTSIDHFVTATKDIFSDNFQADFLNRVAAYDEFCAAGMTENGISFSDHFIQQQTIGRWTREIMDTIVQHCQTVRQSGHPQGDSDIEETTLSLVPNLLSPAEDSSHQTSAIPTNTEVNPTPAEDSSHQTSAIPTNTEVNPTPAPSGCHISQIVLRGSNLFQAWAVHPETREMEAAASRRLLQGEAWDPSHRATRPVYHGTHITAATAIAQTERPILNMADGHRFMGLRGQLNPNQVAPVFDGMHITWTGYGPQRCFLWAVFRSEVIWSLERATAARERTQEKWKCGDHEHTGVLLLKFHPPLQANAYIIPNGREHDWHTICKSTPWQSYYFNRLNEAWSLFSGIHGWSRTSWPEVIHSREHGPQLAMLRRHHVRQLWRTVWHGEAITTLNQSHQVTYAIAWEKTPDTPLSVGGDGSLDVDVKAKDTHQHPSL